MSSNVKLKLDSIVSARKSRQVAGEVLNLYKKMGETPLERLDRLRRQKPEYAYEVLSYAGRLDPMAEGVLVTLVGSANKSREAYLGVDKEYTLDVLFGFSTDTYDVLGRVMEPYDSSMVVDTFPITKKTIERAINEFRGRVSQEYPPFSSKTIDGKPLFELARSGLTHTIVLPRKSVIIYDISVDIVYKLKESQFLSYIETNVGKMNGDFRQEEIIRIWKKHLNNNGTYEFPCATIKIVCSSGTYVRSIANELGRGLGVPALALHILRTRAGEYSSEQSLK